MTAARSGKGDEEVQWTVSVVCWEAERGLVAGCCGEGGGDDCWFGRETKEMGNHGFVGEGQNRWGEAWDLKMGVAGGCWFAQRVGG